MIDADREWLETGGSRSTVVRPEIASSWRRSRLSGVSPDVVSILPGEAPLDCKIARVAVPILGAMAEVLIGANTSLLLSAPDGTMLWRWSEDSRLSALLDRNSAVVGTRWSEDVVGTNGLGTALETVQPITIHGPEHFSESLHPFTCAGAPIRHPITRRVAGTLSVTSLTKDASPLMVATLKKLAREVEEQLYGDSTLRERELLHHFLDRAAPRRQRSGGGQQRHSHREQGRGETRNRSPFAVEPGRDGQTRRWASARSLRPRRGDQLADDRARRVGRRTRDRRR